MRISCHGLECELKFSEPDGEGWMQTTVRVKTPAFEGGFTCAVEKGEWETFVRTLEHLEASVGKDAEVSWGNMEANMEFEFTLQSRGALKGRYRFSPEDVGVGPTLSGEFEADQTFLAGWVRSAQKVLEGAC